jgi:hypothetical protein
MSELKRLREELYSSPAPKGFAASVQDLDILVYEYAAGIMGYADSYLVGQNIKPSSVKINEELDRRIEECLTKLNELKLYKEKYDTLARSLISELSGNLSTES